MREPRVLRHILGVALLLTSTGLYTIVFAEPIYSMTEDKVALSRNLSDTFKENSVPLRYAQAQGMDNTDPYQQQYPDPSQQQSPQQYSDPYQQQYPDSSQGQYQQQYPDSYQGQYQKQYPDPYQQQYPTQYPPQSPAQSPLQYPQTYPQQPMGQPAEEWTPPDQWKPTPPPRQTSACTVKLGKDRSTIHLMDTATGMERKHVSLGQDRVQRVFNSIDGTWSVALFKIRGALQFGFIAFDLAKCEEQLPVNVPSVASAAVFDQDGVVLTFEKGNQRFPLRNQVIQ